MKRLAIDMDEVMADTLQHQLAWVAHHHRLTFNREELRGLSLRSKLSAAVHEALEAALHAGDFFGDIPVMPDSQSVIADLDKAYEVFITSAAMDYPGSCAAKFAWLQRHFNFLPPRRIVFCGEKSILNADFLIDDSPRHFEHFVGQGILFDAPHNAHETRYERVHSWQEVAQRFL